MASIVCTVAKFVSGFIARACVPGGMLTRFLYDSEVNEKTHILYHKNTTKKYNWDVFNLARVGSHPGSQIKGDDNNF